jgi:hypothetical protein
MMLLENGAPPDQRAHDGKTGLRWGMLGCSSGSAFWLTFGRYMQSVLTLYRRTTDCSI